MTIRPIDQSVLDLLRCESLLKVTDLMKRLDVTATAIRQRVDRLEQLGLVEREKLATQRGRPVFAYKLTRLGLRKSGLDYMDLAVAMWSEIQAVESKQVKDQLVRSISKRMGQQYASLLPDSTIRQKWSAMAELMSQRNVPTRVAEHRGLPVLEVQSCPFPDLLPNAESVGEKGIDRSICELEEQIISEAIGEPVKLACCHLDGYHSCQYQTVADWESLVS